MSPCPPPLSVTCAALCAAALVIWATSSPASGQGGGGRGCRGRAAARAHRRRLDARRGAGGRLGAPERDGATQARLSARARSVASSSSSAAARPVRRAQVTLSGQELRGKRTTRHRRSGPIRVPRAARRAIQSDRQQGGSRVHVLRRQASRTARHTDPARRRSKCREALDRACRAAA